MRKILIVTFTMGLGGLENVLMNYFNYIDHDQYQIDFVVNPSDEEPPHVQTIRSSGGHVYHIETPGELGPIKYIKELENIMKAHGPYDVVHANNEYHGGLVSLAAYRQGIPNRIVHSHTDNIPTKRNKLLLPIYRWLIQRYSTKRLACSQAAGVHLFKKDFEVLQNAIDVQKTRNYNHSYVAYLNKKYQAQDKLVLGQIGRLSQEKNIFWSLELLQELNHTESQYILLIIGEGPLRSEIEDYINQYNLFDSVILTGAVDNVNDYLAFIDLLLVPSFYEGLSMVTIEAQAMGTPALVSDRLPKEVDLEMGLVKFLKLNHIKKWMNEIQDFSKPTIEESYIIEKFNERQYEIKTMITRLEDIYSQES